MVSVAESVLAPPGPIPNPVVTQGSAGEYCGGDPVGGEAAAGTTSRPPPCCVLVCPSQPRRGVEQRQLVGLITQRSRVRIPPPPLPNTPPPGPTPGRGLVSFIHLLNSITESHFIHALSLIEVAS